MDWAPQEDAPGPIRYIHGFRDDDGVSELSEGSRAKLAERWKKSFSKMKGLEKSNGDQNKYAKLLQKAKSKDEDFTKIQDLNLLQLPGTDFDKCPIIYVNADRLPDDATLLNQCALYVIRECDKLVNEEYVLVLALAGTESMSSMEVKMSWAGSLYDIFPRKYKKNLKTMFLVQPSFQLKMLMNMFAPTIMERFWAKTQLVHSLVEHLFQKIRFDKIIFPSEVYRRDIAKANATIQVPSREIRRLNKVVRQGMKENQTTAKKIINLGVGYKADKFNPVHECLDKRAVARVAEGLREDRFNTLMSPYEEIIEAPQDPKKMIDIGSQDWMRIMMFYAEEIEMDDSYFWHMQYHKEDSDVEELFSAKETNIPQEPMAKADSARNGATNRPASAKISTNGTAETKKTTTAKQRPASAAALEKPKAETNAKSREVSPVKETETTPAPKKKGFAAKFNEKQKNLLSNDMTTPESPISETDNLLTPQSITSSLRTPKVEDSDALPFPWEEHYHEGYVYYWNPDTDESQWERPVANPQPSPFSTPGTALTEAETATPATTVKSSRGWRDRVANIRLDDDDASSKMISEPDGDSMEGDGPEPLSEAGRKESSVSADTPPEVKAVARPLRRGGIFYVYKQRRRNKRERRWLVLSSDYKRLKWGDSQTKRVATKVILSEVVRIEYGPVSTVFKSHAVLADKPYHCFSLIKDTGETVDLAATSDHDIMTWLPGLHKLINPTGPSLTRGALLWKRIRMKMDETAKSRGVERVKVIAEALMKGKIRQETDA